MHPEASEEPQESGQRKKPEERSGGEQLRYPRNVSEQSWRRLKRYVGPLGKSEIRGMERLSEKERTVFFVNQFRKLCTF